MIVTSGGNSGSGTTVSPTVTSAQEQTAINNSVTAAKATSTGSTTVAGTATAGSGTALLTIGMELGAVGLFAIIADSGDQAASIMLIVLTGLWILWAIQHSGSIAKFSGIITNLSNGV
jgi:hypothetical protein